MKFVRRTMCKTVRKEGKDIRMKFTAKERIKKSKGNAAVRKEGKKDKGMKLTAEERIKKIKVNA